MADKFKWADEYKKRGFEVFDQESVKSLRAIQRKYRSDYRKFFMEVANVEKGQGRPQQVKRVDEVLAKIDKIWHLIDSVLSTTSTRVSEEELKELFLLTNEVDEDFRFFSDPENLSVPMRKRIKEAEEKTSIRARDLAQANRAIKGRMLEAGRKQTVGEKFGHLAPAFKPLADTAKEVGQYMLGPFDTIARAGGAAVGGVSSMIKAHRERKREISRRAFTQSTLLSEEATPEFMNAYSRAGTSGIGPVPKVMEASFRKASPKFAAQEPESARSPFSTRATRERGRQTQQDLGQAFFTFFNKDAYRAKWTRELFEAITGKKGTGGIRGGGDEGGDFGLLDFLGLKEGFRMAKAGFAKLTPVLLALGSAAGVAAGLFASWKLGNWLQDNVPGFKKYGTQAVDEMGEIMVTPYKAGLGITNWWKVGQQRKGMTPLMKRTLHYQDKGMTYAEASSKAAKDLGMPEPIQRRATQEEGVPTSMNAQVAPVPEVPIVTPSGNTEGFETLSQSFEKSMDKMLEGVENMNKGRVFEGSGVDARDIQDPLLSGGLNSGMLGI